jgi:glycerol 2-dehydrogenase (NADP+)
VIRKSTNPQHIAANSKDNRKLAEDEMERIDQLGTSKLHRFNRPDWGTVVFHDDRDVGLL